MRILIVCDVYPPEISSAAHLMQELACGFREKGHQVAVLTAYPRHYLASYEVRKEIPFVSEEEGVRVIRVKVLPHHKVNFFIRGISQLLLPFLFYWALKKSGEKEIDAVVVYSPPLTLGILGYLVKRTYKAKLILNLQDIFPQNAVDLGILKNRFLIKLFEFLEGKVYQWADKITFHSPGGSKFLIEKKRVPAEKVITVYNWLDLESFQRIKKNLSFREKFGLKNKFIFLFAGIIGPAQGLDFLIEVAKRVSDLKEVVFLIVGDGMEKDRLVKKAKIENVRNVVFKEFVSKEDYPNLLSEVDVGIVCLSAKNKTPFIPGKFLGYLAVGKPVLAFLNKESDGFELLRRCQCGYGAEAGDLAKAENYVRLIYKNKNNLKKLGERGGKFAKENFSLERAINEFEQVLRN